MQPTLESVLEFFKSLEEKNQVDDCPLLCIHCDYSGHVKGSGSQIELFSFENLVELVEKLKPYESGKYMSFYQNIISIEEVKLNRKTRT